MFILLKMVGIELKFLMFKTIRTASRPALITILSMIDNTFLPELPDLLSGSFFKLKLYIKYF